VSDLNPSQHCKGKGKGFPILDTERWARSWSRCTGSQPAGDPAFTVSYHRTWVVVTWWHWWSRPSLSRKLHGLSCHRQYL